MDLQLRRRVRERADDRCEYCGLHQSQSPLAALHIEHIIPKKHGATAISTRGQISQDSIHKQA
ncbi:MAG: HNH endonuclease [Pirellula sp.]